MKSKKGFVFTDAFMALIISSVVVIMIITGTTISYKNLACYTGISWLSESPGAHLGTIANSKISIDITGPLISNYTFCSSNCETANTECNKNTKTSSEPCSTTEEETCLTAANVNCEVTRVKCMANCNIDFLDRTADYAYFSLDVGYNGASANLNISESQNTTTGVETYFWYEKTGTMTQGDSITLSTKPFKLDHPSFPCTIIFKGVALDKTGIVPAEKSMELKVKNVNYCLGN